MDIPPIYIVSGGKGISGEQLVRTALAQFAPPPPPVLIVPDVRNVTQLETVIAQAVVTGGMIVHTLVDASLRTALMTQVREHHIMAIDLMSPLLIQLEHLLGQRSLGQPGLYRQLREDYFDRIAAIEFTVDHDDGRRPHELDRADIVLAGVSRVGKTPLSMYLSTRGWKVANVPLIPEVLPPSQLFEIDHRRVVGLYIDASQLIMYRQRRRVSLGLPKATAYTDLTAIEEELHWARQVFQQSRFGVVNMTDKPIEESAEEVIAHVTWQLKSD